MSNQPVSFDGKSLAINGKSIYANSAPFVEANGKRLLATGHFDDCACHWHFAELPQLVWLWKWSWRGQRLVVESKLVNNGGDSIRLGKVCWVDTDDYCLPNYTPHNVEVLENPYGGRAYHRQIKRLDDEGCWRCSAHFVQFSMAATKEALQIGFLTFLRTYNFIAYEDRLTVASDFVGWELQPHSETTCDVFTVTFGNNPMTQLENWADQAADIVKPQFNHKPAIGWLGWSWVNCLGSATENCEQLLLENAKAIQKKLNGYGIEYAWVSVLNIPGGNPGDYLHWNTTRFPSGNKGVCEKLAEHGLKLGLWVGPYMLSNHLEQKVEEFDDATLRRPDGEKMIYSPIWSHGDAGLVPAEKRPQIYALDPSHPKVRNYLKQVFEQYRANGVRYYMLDFLEAGSGSIQRHPYKDHFDHSLTAGPEVLTSSLAEIRQTVGPDTFILTSTGPTLQMAGAADAVRVGNDFGEGRSVTKGAYFYPASFVINGSFTAAAAALGFASLSYYTHGKLYQNNCGNVLTVDKPLPLETAWIHATIHALSGSCTMLGDDIRYISDDRLSIIKKTLPRGTEAAKPLDLFNCDQWPPHRFHLSVRDVSEPYEVVALYNFSAESRTESIPFENLGLPADATYVVWEFWHEAYMGCMCGELTAVVPPESVRVYRLTPQLDRPQIIGTDMHVLMGQVELNDIHYCKKTKTLEFTATRPTGETGSVFLLMPQNLHIVDSGICYTARNRNGTTGDLIVRIPLHFDTDTITRQIHFERIDSDANDKLT